MFTFAFVIFLMLVSMMPISAQTTAQNPIIWADVLDPSVIRIGDVYYMSSTTMHMSPGVPIMKSMDLVNWKTVNYAYDLLADNDALNLSIVMEPQLHNSILCLMKYLIDF